MLFTTRVIDLSDDLQIAKGTVRIVYDFPDQPDLLIKVFHAAADRSSRKPLKRFAWKLVPTLRYRSLLSELRCEALVSLKLGSDIDTMPLSRMLGTVQTSRGAGVVVERIRSLDGGLAPQLRRLFRERTLEDAPLNALNALVQKMFDLHIVARDINLSNIVYGTRGEAAACFLIDGYGERNVIPLRSMSKRLNDRSLDRQFAKIAEKSGLVWNSSQRLFSNAR